MKYIAIPVVFRLALHKNLRAVNAVFLTAKDIEGKIRLLPDDHNLHAGTLGV